MVLCIQAHPEAKIIYAFVGHLMGRTVTAQMIISWSDGMQTEDCENIHIGVGSMKQAVERQRAWRSTHHSTMLPNLPPPNLRICLALVDRPRL